MTTDSDHLDLTLTVLQSTNYPELELTVNRENWPSLGISDRSIQQGANYLVLREIDKDAGTFTIEHSFHKVDDAVCYKMWPKNPQAPLTTVQKTMIHGGKVFDGLLLPTQPRVHVQAEKIDDGVFLVTIPDELRQRTAEVEPEPVANADLWEGFADLDYDNKTHTLYLKLPYYDAVKVMGLLPDFEVKLHYRSVFVPRRGEIVVVQCGEKQGEHRQVNAPATRVAIHLFSNADIEAHDPRWKGRVPIRVAKRPDDLHEVRFKLPQSDTTFTWNVEDVAEVVDLFSRANAPKSKVVAA